MALSASGGSLDDLLKTSQAFGSEGPGIDSKLASIFSPIYQNAQAQVSDNTATQLKQLRANQAARGVLRSGVSDIPAGDIMKGGQLALGNVSSGLANILGNTEASRSLFGTQADFEKMMADAGFGYSSQLADQIANANKPSTLSQIFGGIGSVAPLVSSLASLF